MPNNCSDWWGTNNPEHEEPTKLDTIMIAVEHGSYASAAIELHAGDTVRRLNDHDRAGLAQALDAHGLLLVEDPEDPAYGYHVLTPEVAAQWAREEAEMAAAAEGGS